MRILIAEDERDLAEALCALFEKNQFSADAVGDGVSAYEYASSGEYDAIILDVMMPKLDGFEVLRALRRDGISTPIMMLTAKGQKDDRITGFNAGADDYLPKPFEPDELICRVRAMLRRALFEMTGPVAIRYPRGGEGAFTADTSAGDFAELRTGKDITLCAYGTLINNVLGAAELLHEDGIEARVVKLNRISPFRGGELSRIFGTTKRLLVAEECSGVGCIGQRIAAILAEEGHEPQRLMLCNLGRRFIEQGSVGELYRQCGLDAESLARTAKEVCQ